MESSSPMNTKNQHQLWYEELEQETQKYNFRMPYKPTQELHEKFSKLGLNLKNFNVMHIYMIKRHH